MIRTAILFFAFFGGIGVTQAQTLTYGQNINLEQAKKVIAAAEAEARKNQWNMAIAVVDTGGNLVLFQRMDNTQIGSIEIAKGKASTANNFKRPSRALEEAIEKGGIGLRLLAVPGVFPLEGGELIFLDGKIIGAIGVSGAQSTQDGQVAKAGVAALSSK
ncbi:GlcG/HbpS family heme-binding protein [Leptospira selangorensis]|uniref:GlcG/HbpS family heme-binding protein n=1 Tax=Leptospira selangorensis TaxID=2484982 RepID=UPI001FC9A473|nr:heme-binding protein [Leptospira selangorensis]